MSPSRSGTRTSYRLALREPHSHHLEVEARFADAAAHGDEVELRMAAWTPGSYLVRDYARHLADLTVTDERGQALVARKVDKAAWRVKLQGGRDLVARYRVYGWELTVRTNHVDQSHAFVNGAPTWLWIPARAGEPCSVTVDAPAGWRVVAGPAPDADGAYQLADLDELIDTPFHLGPDPVIELTVMDRPTEIALWGRPDAGGVVDLGQLGADVTAIMEAHAKIFGGAQALPYQRYAFMLMLAAGAYGGLEHRCSCALLSTPFAFSTRKKYEELLELISHEYFHLWNVKRIRPRALGPFDYSRENYTRALWVMEGFTSYYDRHALVRARLQPPKRYLAKLAEEWGKLLAIPGRARQSIEESSFDAWIKLYRPDENTVNSTVSYYLKGGLVSLCLDLEIRRRSGGTRSLDDVLAQLWRDYGARGVGFDEEGFQAEVERATGLELGDFFDRCVRGREDPDLAGALAGVGLELKATWEKPPGEGMGEGAPPWLGVNTRSEAGGRVTVSATLAGSPAEAAGIYAGDELLALDGYKITESSLAERLAARRPGDRVRMTLFRREALTEVTVELAAAPKDKFEILPASGAPAEAVALRNAWIGELG